MKLTSRTVGVIVHLVALGWLSLGSADSALALPIQWSSGTGANFHFYEFVQVVDPTATSPNYSANTLAAATAAATSAGGYLATVSSAEENAFLFGLVTTNGFTGFLGSWLDGGGSTFRPWDTGYNTEPNNGGAAAYMHIGTGSFGGGIDPSEWADDSGVIGTPSSPQDPVIGYFIEYDTNPAAVPEPASLALFGAGLAGLVARARRRNRRSPSRKRT